MISRISASLLLGRTFGRSELTAVIHCKMYSKVQFTFNVRDQHACVHQLKYDNQRRTSIMLYMRGPPPVEPSEPGQRNMWISLPRNRRGFIARSHTQSL